MSQRVAPWSVRLRAGLGTLLLALLLVGCGGRAESALSFKEAAASVAPAPQASRSAGADMQKVYEQAPAEQLDEAAAQSTPGASPAASMPSPEARKRIYSGYCRLVVDDVEATKRALGSFAEANDGYVESAAGGTIVLRVPAARFRELFEQVLGFGQVTRRAVETQDVSDTFRDLQMRLQISQSARERLYRLLERASEVEERLAILREIKRLSEQIERIRLSLDSLERLVAFSRITVELESRLSAVEQTRESIPFPWIAGLDPLYASLAGRSRLPRQWRGLPEALGDEFAVLEKRRDLRAESPEGTRLRLGSTPNQPRGDAEFWQKALAHHLGPLYRSAEMVQLGPFRGVLLTSKDREPFVYLVAVSAQGGRLFARRTLRVLEVFFPSLDAMNERLPAVRAACQSLEAAP